MKTYPFPETNRTLTEVLAESAAILDEWVRTRQQWPTSKEQR
jgi:hypothetical protein